MIKSLIEAIEAGSFFRLTTTTKSGDTIEEPVPHLWLIEGLGVAFVKDDWNFKVNSSRSAHKILGEVKEDDSGFWTIDDAERNLSWKIVKWVTNNKDNGDRPDALVYLLSWEPELTNESLLPVKVKT